MLVSITENNLSYRACLLRGSSPSEALVKTKRSPGAENLNQLERKINK